MRILKARNYSVKEGHYSVWAVLCSARDIASIARNNAENKTMNPVTYFKLVTKMGNKDGISFAKLSSREDMENPTKTWKFGVEVVTDEDANTDVFFTPSKPVILCDKAYGMPHNQLVSRLQYHFSCDFLNYTSGSTYRLFEDLLKSGEFAEVDGTAYVEKKETPKGFTADDEKDVKDFLQKLKEAKAAEYAKRDELNGKTPKEAIAEKIEAQLANSEAEAEETQENDSEDAQIERETQIIIPEDLEENTDDANEADEAEETYSDENDADESAEAADALEGEEETEDAEEAVESSEQDEEDYFDGEDSGGDDEDADIDSEDGDEAEEDGDKEYSDEEYSDGAMSDEEPDDETLREIEELMEDDEDEDSEIPKIRMPISAD